MRWSIEKFIRRGLIGGFGLLLAAGGSAESLRVALVLDATQPEFAARIQSGVEQAARGEAAGVSLELLCRPGDRAGQARTVEESVRDGVDVVILDAIDRQAVATPLARAAQAHVAVILVNSSWAAAPATTVVATDNREAGRAAARELGRLLGGRGGVLLLRHQIHAAKAEAREEGFIEVLTREFPGLVLVASDYHAGPTAESAGRVADGLLARYHGRIDGVFASCESATQGMLAALRRAGLAGGQVKLVGSDEAGGSLAPALQAGDLQAYLAEDPVAMGDLALKSAVATARGGMVVPVMATGLTLVNSGGTTAVPPGPGNLAEAMRGMFVAPPCPATVPLVREELLVPGLGLAMIPVEPGRFRRVPEGGMVTISRRFWLGQCEVTQRQWMKIMPENPSEFKGDCLPVDNISWADAMEFCHRLNDAEHAAGRLPAGYRYTLPTEAQWEFAACAGRKGNLEQPDPGWWATNSGEVQDSSGIWCMSPHAVGQKAANAWGLHDLSGNVAEWCLDWAEDYPVGDAADPAGPPAGTYRVLRGGCWWADAQNCLAGSRHKAPPARHHSGLGMRLALSPVETGSVRNPAKS